MVNVTVQNSELTLVHCSQESKLWIVIHTMQNFPVYVWVTVTEVTWKSHMRGSYPSRVRSRRNSVNFLENWARGLCSAAVPRGSVLVAFDERNPSVIGGFPPSQRPVTRSFVIQIKICAEYRDMLPRPRLVCLEPGLGPIGRSPGVPDKSSRGLGSMSRYSAQILICFIAYIFLFLFLCGFGWELCRTASMHSALCHCPL